jgi:glycosyltransferase involved in cell wall biosynthesis
MLSDFRAGDALICASESSRDVVVRQLRHFEEHLSMAFGAHVAFPGTVELVPFGIDTTFFRPLERERAREQLGLSPNGHILLWYGRLEIAKQDLLPLLLVTRRLREKNPTLELRLVIAGPESDAGYRRVLRKRAEELGIAAHVEFLDTVPRPKVPLLYNSSDVFACVSNAIYENFGITVLEAMACGVPVVAMDWAGYRDAIVPGISGFLIPTKWAPLEEDLESFAGIMGLDTAAVMSQSIGFDCEALEHSVGALLRDALLAEQCGDAARRRVEAHYSLASMADHYLRVFHSMLAGASASRKAPAKHPPAVPMLALRECFAANPARTLELQTTVALTEDGASVLAGRDGVTVLAVPGNPIDERTLEELFDILSESESDGSVSVESIVARLRERTALRKEITLRHLTWLLKQGYLRVS